MLPRTGFQSRAEAYEDFDDTPTNPNLSRTIGDVINERFGRRDMLRGMLGVAAISATVSPLALAAASRSVSAATSRYVFDEISHGVDETHHVAPGYDAEILIRWGDPVLADAPEFDPMNQTPQAQASQFGYNCDYVGYVPLGEGRGLLCVNHEYTSPEVMFPGLGGPPADNNFEKMTKDLVDVEMAAHGGAVLEIAKGSDGKWAVVRDSDHNRRITAETEMTVDGPAAGAERMKTSADGTGTKVLGTINNCAGGITPWGTYLMAEENFHGYFWTDQKNADGEAPDDIGGAQQASYARYGVPGGWYNWGQFHDRFNVDLEPNEPNRFGWVVEVDPTDPNATPVKHTALGRFRHEGAENILNADGRVVVYTGDDNRFDYLYKFVSSGTYNPDDREASKSLLSDGTLYVARFDADGSMAWLPLVHGAGPLTAENGFASQADVLIDARLAADALGATPMDRPEDVEPNPQTNKVYMMLTNNTRRKEDQVDAVNPRPDNAFGHIIEMTPPDGDHAATEYTWDILVRCGDPRVAEVGAAWNPETSENGWFGMPDNCAVDNAGRLWISTDGNWPDSKTADGFWALETEGELRGTGRMFFRVPIGAEMCGPLFVEDDTTLFLAVQHPATDDPEAWEPFGRASTFEDPATRWPDFKDGMPPRPSVLVITKQGGGKIGV